MSLGQRQTSNILTANPILSPCVRQVILGLEPLAEDWMNCSYCCALQTVPLTPSDAVITIAVNGLERWDETMLVSVWSAEKEGLGDSELENDGNKRESTLAPYESVLTDHTALETSGNL